LNYAVLDIENAVFRIKPTQYILITSSSVHGGVKLTKNNL